MDATRRSIRITLIDRDLWEISAVDTTYLSSGAQRRELKAIRLVSSENVRSVMAHIVNQHISDQLEQQRQGDVAAAERD